MTAPNSKNEDPQRKIDRQRVCKHRFDAWFIPKWDTKHKYRTCLNCEFVEILQIRV